MYLLHIKSKNVFIGSHLEYRLLKQGTWEMLRQVFTLSLTIQAVHIL